MGRRAKKQAVQTKKMVKLSKRFKCPFCSNDDTVECKMDFKASIGSLKCRVCGSGYQMPIHHLHEPVDVFSEWLDDCEAVANPQHEQPQQPSAQGELGPGGQVDDLLDDEEEDEDDDLPHGSGLAAARGSQKPASSASSPSKKSSSSNKRSIDIGLSDDDDDDDD